MCSVVHACLRAYLRSSSSTGADRSSECSSSSGADTQDPAAALPPRLVCAFCRPVYADVVEALGQYVRQAVSVMIRCKIINWAWFFSADDA